MEALKNHTILNTVEKDFKALSSRNGHKGIFILKSGNQWLKDASEKPQPKPLYLKLFYEGEVCIMFAETGAGKSIKAVQIGVKISEDQPVIYFDFELSEKQFENRYSNDYTDHYRFPENFYRAEINPDEADFEAAGFRNLEDYINYSIEQAIKETGARVLIIDNLTYLKDETEKAKAALPLMKHLKSLKSKYCLSILALAHTPKRDFTKPITRNDLAGSKMLINFCDSAFAIGESAKNKSLRYLKQIKARNGEIEYDSENVALYTVSKPDNFLFMAFTGFTHEHEHLQQRTEKDREELIIKAKELNKQGKSQREIAKELCVAASTVNNYINKI